MLTLEKQPKIIHHLEISPVSPYQAREEAKQTISWANRTGNRFNKSAAFRHLNTVSKELYKATIQVTGKEVRRLAEDTKL